MRAVQTERSTHHQRSRASPACVGERGGAAPATAAGLTSSFWFSIHPLSCVPWLRGRYPLPRYYGRSDSDDGGSSAREGHEHRSVPPPVSLIPVRGLPAILSPAICGRTGVVPVARRFGLGILSPADRLRLSLADSPLTADRIEFTLSPGQGRRLLRTGRSPSVALHPGLPRRSYGRLPHGSSPQGSGLSPLRLRTISGARARLASGAAACYRRASSSGCVWRARVAAPEDGRTPKPDFSNRLITTNASHCLPSCPDDQRQPRRISAPAARTAAASWPSRV